MHALALTLALSTLAPPATAPPTPPVGETAPAASAPPAAAPTPAAAPAPAPAAAAAAAPIAQPSSAAVAPAPEAAAPPPAAAAPEPPPPIAAAPSPVEAPPAPVLTAAVLDPSWEPQRPSARSGRWLIGTSLGLGVLGWGLAIGQSAVSRHCQVAIDGQDIDPNPEACLYEFNAGLSAMGAARGLANISNWGVAGAAGGIRGNYDAIDHVWTNRARRRHGLWIGGGIALSVVGMAVGAIATSSLSVKGCEETGCVERIPGAVLGQQAAQTIFTAGIGMFSYGMVYGYEYRQNHAYRHRIAKGTLRAAPALSADYGGISVSGRF